MYDLTSFERDIMYVLAGEKALNGRDVRSRLEQYYTSDVYDGRLYPSLNKLVEKGFVEKSTANSRSNHYQLSERGRREVEYRRRWEQEVAGEIDA